MCLCNIDKKPARKSGIGYKVVKKLNGGQYVCYDYGPHAGEVTYPLNQWITDPNDGDAEGIYVPKYRTGFHISLDRKDMDKIGNPAHPIIKVRFRKVTATQCHNPDSIYGRQVVAREIMNLGEVK